MAMQPVPRRQDIQQAALHAYFNSLPGRGGGRTFLAEDIAEAKEVARYIRGVLLQRQEQDPFSSETVVYHDTNGNEVRRGVCFVGREVIFISKDPPREGSFKRMVSGFIPSDKGVDPVAILTVHNPSANDEREIAILKKLKDQPWAIQLRDNFKVGQTIVMLQDLCKGGTLRDLIVSKQNQWTKGELVFIVYQILHMLNELHRRGIVHRDIKADNILLKDGAETLILQLADYGFACPQHSPPAGMELAGTPSYVAPEVGALLIHKSKLKREMDYAKTQLGADPVANGLLLQQIEKKEEQLRALTAAASGCAADLFSAACIFAELVQDPALLAHLQHIVRYLPRDMQGTALMTKRGTIGLPPALNIKTSHAVARLAARLLHPNPQQRATIPQVLQDPLLMKKLSGSPPLRRAIEQNSWDIDTLFNEIFGTNLIEEHKRGGQEALDQARFSLIEQQFLSEHNRACQEIFVQSGLVVLQDQFSQAHKLACQDAWNQASDEMTLAASSSPYSPVSRVESTPGRSIVYTPSGIGIDFSPDRGDAVTPASSWRGRGRFRGLPTRGVQPVPMGDNSPQRQERSQVETPTDGTESSPVGLRGIRAIAERTEAFVNVFGRRGGLPGRPPAGGIRPRTLDVIE